MLLGLGAVSALAKPPQALQDWRQVHGKVADGPSPVVSPPNPANDTVINLADYKTVNGTANSDWKAMVLALQACEQTHAAALNIPHGTYSFDDPKILQRNMGGHIQVAGRRDFTIQGNDSTFIFHHLRNGFDFSDCQRVLITNLTIQWDLDLAVPATVSVANNLKVLIVDPSFPISQSTPVGAVTEYDIQNLRWKMNAKEIYRPKNVTLSAPQTLSSPDFSMFAEGSTVAVRTYVYAARGFEFSFGNNADLTFDHVTVKNCPGMAFVGYGADRGFRFTHCAIERRDPLRDLVSTGADGIHIGMSRGDCIIENCDFSYLGDDAVNIHSIWMNMVDRVDDHTAKISTIVYDPTYVSVGDQLQFLQSANLQPIGQSHVTAVVYDAAAQAYTITFDERLPDTLSAGSCVANLNRNSARYVVRNNQFHDHRARGVLAQAPDGLITNNHIQNVMGAAIQLTADNADWHEGYGCTDVSITNNVCEGCNGGLWGGFKNEPGICMGVINVFCQTAQGAGDYATHQRILIANNTVKNTPNISFFVSSAADLTLKDNVIQDCPPSATQGVFITHASHITVSGNQAVNCSMRRGQGIYVESATTSDVTLTDNTGF